MANILPTNSLKAIRNSYQTRFLFVGSLISIVCALVAFLALIPAYAVVHVDKIDKTADVLLQESPSIEQSSDREEIARAQFLLGELQMIATSTASVLDLLDEVLSVRPKGARVESINMTRAPRGTIVIGGFASLREEINEYRMALAENSRFENLSVPIGILAGTNDNRFTITLTGSF